MSFIPCNTLCYAWCFPCRHQCTWKVISETWPVSFLSDEKPLFSLRKSHMLMDLGLHEWPSACISSLIFIFINLSYIHDLSCHNLKQWGIKFNPIWKILNKKQIKSQHLQYIWFTLTPAKDKKWEAIKITILVITFRTLQYTPPPPPLGNVQCQESNISHKSCTVYGLQHCSGVWGKDLLLGISTQMGKRNGQCPKTFGWDCSYWGEELVSVEITKSIPSSIDFSTIYGANNNQFEGFSMFLIERMTTYWSSRNATSEPLISLMVCYMKHQLLKIVEIIYNNNNFLSRKLETREDSWNSAKWD